uniref:16S rRNA (cytosine(1402)-N(4))-methyltransferase n=1 Tax=Staphylococcus hominis TaxID=1290 RepID=UPI0011A7309A
EKFSKQIPRTIQPHPQQQPIQTTLHLLHIIKQPIPAKPPTKPPHPPKPIFQAITIPLNHQLSPFQHSIQQPIQHLKLKPTISLITFHSLQHTFSNQIFQQYQKP